MSAADPQRPSEETPVENGPIVVPCEGSSLVGHVMPTGVMCQMCGIVWPQFPVPSMFDKVPQHDRLDIVAMVERGDFG
jgi:hypothetical protein